MANKKEHSDKKESTKDDDLNFFIPLNIDKETKNEIVQYCKDNKIKINQLIKKLWKQYKIGGNIDGTIEQKMLHRYSDLFAYITEQEKRYHTPILNQITRLAKTVEENIALVNFDDFKANNTNNLPNNNDDLTELNNLKVAYQKLLTENIALKNMPQNNQSNSNNIENNIIDKLLLLVGLLEFKDNNIKELISIPDAVREMKFYGKIHSSNYYKACLNIFNSNDFINLLDTFKKSKKYTKFINNAQI